jgi:hypothetical protein
MNRGVAAVPAARTEPRRRRHALAGLCTVALAGGLAGPARAADAPAAVDVPVQEHAPDAPPAGIRIAPGLTLSGYATAQLLVPDRRGGAGPSGSSPSDGGAQASRRTRLDLSHLSGIVWWEPSPAWKALAEVDLQDVVQLPAHDDANDGRDSSAYVALDRLYVDWRQSDSLAVRAGKFLTPIGRWNQDHSDPQTWTVLRPLLSDSAFPTSATGLMLFGSVPVATQWVDWQVWGSDGDDLRTSPRTSPFGHAVGARVSTALNPDLQLGLSASRYTEAGATRIEYDLTGIDGAWRFRRAEFSAEAIVRRANDGAAGQEHGWFVQGVMPVADRWWAVARLEAYRRAFDARENRTALLGVVYRSGQHWVFKAEWARASDRASGLPSGLLSSVTLVY